MSKYLAELLGTFLIVLTVAGAGHMVFLLGADEAVGLAAISGALGLAVS